MRHQLRDSYHLLSCQMNQTRRAFTKEFKQECVRLIENGGYGVEEASKAKRPKQHRYPVIGQASSIAPNTLNHQLRPTQFNSHWTGDITYIRTTQGCLYLTIVLDLYSRRVVGWKFSGQPMSKCIKSLLNNFPLC
jgi:Integrase core domain